VPVTARRRRDVVGAGAVSPRLTARYAPTKMAAGRVDLARQPIRLGGPGSVVRGGVGIDVRNRGVDFVDPE